MRSPCAISRKCAPSGGGALFRRAVMGEVPTGCFSKAGRSIFRARAAIPLNASNTQAREAMEFERTIPGTELFFRELVDAAIARKAAPRPPNHRAAFSSGTAQ